MKLWLNLNPASSGMLVSFHIRAEPGNACFNSRESRRLASRKGGRPHFRRGDQVFRQTRAATRWQEEVISHGAETRERCNR